MFTDADFALNFAPVSADPQLILIPVSENQGFIAVAKAFGKGKAACIVFAPAVKLGAALDGFVPQFLRKVVTNDFSLRTGKWEAVGLTAANANLLRETVAPLMTDLEDLSEEQMEIIDMEHPMNMSSAPAVACNTFRADENTPFEKALSHLLALVPSNVNENA